MGIHTRAAQDSFWNNYPEMYKFMSFDFMLNLDVVYYERKSYDFLDLFGDLGGLMSILTMSVSGVAFHFAKIRINALVTNRMNHVTEDNKKEIFGRHDLSEKEMKDHNLYKSEFGQTKVEVPSNLLWNYLRYKLPFCWK